MCLLVATEAILENVPQGKKKVFRPAQNGKVRKITFRYILSLSLSYLQQSAKSGLDKVH